MIDVTDVSGVKEGDEVVLLGRQRAELLTAEELAGQLGTIHYEVITRINPLIERRIVR
jgi:alanine racemase